MMLVRRASVCFAVALLVLLAPSGTRAFATHVSCGTTIYNDTTLDSDLTCAGNGIEIGADGITLDLNGHKIEGPGATHNVFGVGGSFRSRVVVENGFIRNYGNGVALARAADSVVRDLQLDGNDTGILFWNQPTNNLVMHNTVRGRIVSSAIRFEETSWFSDRPFRPSNNRAVGNRVEDAFIDLWIVDGSSVTDNIIERGGIRVLGNYNPEEGSNAAEANAVERNRVSDGYDYGIVLSLEASENLVRGNEVSGGIRPIVVLLSHHNRVEANRTSGGSEAGIEIANYEAHDDVVVGNTATGNRDGILVDDSAVGTVVQENVTSENTDDGIDVDHSSTTITRNSAFRNGDWGIEAVAGVTDGGGNRAWSNMQPLQCLNVQCGPGPPASVVLSPASAVNEVGSQHCVTARVSDPDGAATAGITVRFRVTGSPAGNTSDGARVTDGNGRAMFCYAGPPFGPSSDAISAYADTDGNGSRGGDEPGGTAGKTWRLPATTAGCKITGSGAITAQNGDRGSLSLSVKEKNGAPDGGHGYRDEGPAQPLTVTPLNVSALTCRAGSGSVYGEARVDGSGRYLYRVDVADRGEPGSSDRYRIRLSGYDSGERTLVTGNLQVR